MQAPVLTSQAGRVVIGLGASAALSAALLRFMPESLLGAEAFPLLIIGIVLAAGLCVCSSSSAAPSYRTPLLFLWWVLLTSEEYFIRWSTSESTLQGNLSPEAYAEAAIWLSVLAAVVVLG